MGPFGRLRVLDGKHAGMAYDLEAGEHTLGRDPDAVIHIGDPTVSKDQALVRCSRGGAVLENRSARNPTQVNGEALSRPHPLRAGDEIMVGTVRLRFEAPEAAPVRPARAAPAPAAVAAEEPEGGAHGTRMLRRPWVVISQPGAPVRDETLYADVMQVGRAPDCEIMLDFPMVSGHHAKVELKGGRYTLTDEGSTNGTSVNGRLLAKPHELQDGDIVRIGDVSGNSVSLTYHEEGTEMRDELSTVAIRRLQVEGKDTFTIGRDPTCEVKLEGSLVSWRHARVDKVEGGHAITDLGSTNGTFVSGQRVDGKRKLSTGDIIHIGPHKFVYTAGGFSQSSAAGRVRLDGVRILRSVGSGKTARVLLNDISLTIQPREFVCFVGGSGAGKSTLMKAFAGIFHVDGEVLVNGEDLITNYDAWKGMIGYVPQDDIVHGDLTVDHAVRYSAKLRLPKDTKRDELNRVIDRVLGDVEMLPHRDKLIRSLSGGQRKRVSIAVEMLSEPSLFYLDEPTSGLDPGLEKKMMYMMRRLADGGRTIIMVTHATANITQCDHVAFLARGRMVWFGPPAEALEHFAVKDFSDIYTEIEKDPEGLERKYRMSKAFQKYVVERQKKLSGRTGESGTFRTGSMRAPMIEKRTAGAVRQFFILTKRYAELVFRDRVLLAILLLVMPAIGTMLALMSERWWLVGRDRAALDHILDGEAGKMASFSVFPHAQTLLFMTALAVVLLGLFGAAYEIVKERAVYRRERMVNLRIGPYLLSKVVVLFGFAVIQCAALAVILRCAVDPPAQSLLPMDPYIPAAWAGLVEIYVTLLLTALASILMGLFLSAIAPNANTVIYIVLLAVFGQILLTGTIFELPVAARPASYAMVTRWSLESLGSTTDMDALQRQDRFRVSLKPGDLGRDFEKLVETGAVSAPGPVTIAPEPGEKESKGDKLEMRYQHDRSHLLVLWSALAGFSVAFGVLTAMALAWKDRQEG